MVLDNHTQVKTKSLNLSGGFLTLTDLVTTGLLRFTRLASGFAGSVTSRNEVVSLGFCDVSSYFFIWVVVHIS